MWEMNDCRKLIEEGYTKEAADELCETAKAIGVKPSKLISAAKKLEKEGIALSPSDWLVIKEVLDKGFSLSTVVEYIIKRRRAGLSPSQIMEELPVAANLSVKRGHILSNLLKALEAPEYFVVEDDGKTKRTILQLFRRG
ncbi:MAG: flagellar biosynthesis protein FlaJ [Thermoproteus sp.]